MLSISHPSLIWLSLIQVQNYILSQKHPPPCSGRGIPIFKNNLQQQQQQQQQQQSWMRGAAKKVPWKLSPTPFLLFRGVALRKLNQYPISLGISTARNRMKEQKWDSLECNHERMCQDHFGVGEVNFYPCNSLWLNFEKIKFWKFTRWKSAKKRRKRLRCVGLLRMQSWNSLDARDPLLACRPTLLTNVPL